MTVLEKIQKTYSLKAMKNVLGENEGLKTSALAEDISAGMEVLSQHRSVVGRGLRAAHG